MRELLEALFGSAILDGPGILVIGLEVVDPVISHYHRWLVEDGYFGKMPDRLSGGYFSAEPERRARLQQAFSERRLFSNGPLLLPQVREDLIAVWPHMRSEFSCCVIGHTAEVLLIDATMRAASRLDDSEEQEDRELAQLMATNCYQLMDQISTKRCCSQKRLRFADEMEVVPERLRALGHNDEAEQFEQIREFQLDVRN